MERPQTSRAPTRTLAQAEDTQDLLWCVEAYFGHLGGQIEEVRPAE